MCVKKLFNRLFSKKHENEEFSEPGVYNIERELPEGAVKEYGMIELMGRAISTPVAVYVPVRITVYKDRWEFEFNKSRGDEITSDFENCIVQVPDTSDAEKISITLDGIEFVWDEFDGFFRWVPFGEAQSERKFNNYMEYFSNGELRINKEYADHNLSDEAKQYCCLKCDDYYCFNVHDGSYAPVLFEMPSLFDKKEKFMASRFEYFQAEKGSAANGIMCTNRYIHQKFPGQSVPELYRIYDENEQRVLWEPDNK